MFKHAVHRLGFNIPSAQNARDDRLAEVSRVPLYGNFWEIDGLGSVKGSAKIRPVMNRGIGSRTPEIPSCARTKLE